MAINPEKTVRKIFSLPKELWERVDDFRFANRIGTESEAIRRLIERGLLTSQPQDTSAYIDLFNRCLKPAMARGVPYSAFMSMALRALSENPTEPWVPFSQLIAEWPDGASQPNDSATGDCP